MSVKISGKKLNEVDWQEADKHFAEQQSIYRLFAIKTKLSQKLWQKKCVKHRSKDSAFQGYWQTDWQKIENSKRR